MFKAKSKFIRVSPYKMRPLADVIRGYNVERALAWLKTYAGTKRVSPLEKVIFSAYSNAKHAEENLTMRDLRIKILKVDQGPSFSYFKPSAMGRAAVLRKRLSHLEIGLEKIIKVDTKKKS